jgi:hypothetical protein
MIDKINKAERNKANYLAAKAAFNEKDISKCVAFFTPLLVFQLSASN